MLSIIFQEYSKLLTTIEIHKDMEAVVAGKTQVACECEQEHNGDNYKLEL